MGRLDQKTALITGGTSGLGYAIAERFLDEGASVVITGRDEGLGARAERTLGAIGGARFVRADAALEGDVTASVEAAVGFLGGLDVLVNNAGVGVQATLLETPLADFDRVMAVNVRGCFLYAKASFRHLEARGGSMIHNASDAGVLGEVDAAAYSVAKAAIIMLSNMLAIEGGRRGVRSNAICPGDTYPGMRHMAPPGGPSRPERWRDWSLPPLGRLGRAEDVAAACVYLASEEASFVNGAALLVDGGMRAGYRTETPQP